MQVHQNRWKTNFVLAFLAAITFTVSNLSSLPSESEQRITTNSEASIQTSNAVTNQATLLDTQQRSFKSQSNRYKKNLRSLDVQWAANYFFEKSKIHRPQIFKLLEFTLQYLDHSSSVAYIYSGHSPPGIIA